MIRRTSFTILLALSAFAFAQRTAQAQELPKPGPEHAKLKKMEGNWDCVFEMQGQKSKATASYKSICGGMWMANDFKGEVFGIPFTGHGLDGYDQHEKKYVGIWVQSVESAPMHYEGNHDDKGVLVMTGTSPGADGKPQKYKNTTAWKDDDHFTFKMFMIGEDDEEQLAFTIEYSRKK